MKLFHRHRKKYESEPYEEIERIRKSCLVGIEVTIQKHTHVKTRCPTEYAIEV